VRGHIRGRGPELGNYHLSFLIRRPASVAAPDQGRRDRACQEDCTNGVGHDGQRRAIQATRRACGVNEIAPDRRRDVKVGRRTARNAEPVDPAIGTTHLGQSIVECDSLIGT
jgi:hypothetical protein